LFGLNSAPTKAIFVDNNHINCTTPPGTYGDVPFYLKIAANDKIVDTNLNFTYYCEISAPFWCCF
jgi:hypothetical protein